MLGAFFHQIIAVKQTNNCLLDINNLNMHIKQIISPIQLSMLTFNKISTQKIPEEDAHLDPKDFSIKISRLKFPEAEAKMIEEDVEMDELYDECPNQPSTSIKASKQSSTFDTKAPVSAATRDANVHKNTNPPPDHENTQTVNGIDHPQRLNFANISDSFDRLTIAEPEAGFSEQKSKYCQQADKNTLEIQQLMNQENPKHAGPKNIFSRKFIESSNNEEKIFFNNKRMALYKTEMCRSFSEVGHCKYGDRCQFSHSNVELRGVSRHPKYKTETCRVFWEQGTCPYGRRCCFVHYENSEQNKKFEPGKNTRQPAEYVDDDGDLMFSNELKYKCVFKLENVEPINEEECESEGVCPADDRASIELEFLSISVSSAQNACSDLSKKLHFPRDDTEECMPISDTPASEDLPLHCKIESIVVDSSAPLHIFDESFKINEKFSIFGSLYDNLVQMSELNLIDHFASHKKNCTFKPKLHKNTGQFRSVWEGNAVSIWVQNPINYIAKKSNCKINYVNEE